MSHLRNLRSKNAGNIIFSYLNINSIRNKFENLCELVAGNVDILCIAETKLDPSFPNSQFLIPGFHKPLRIDLSSRRGELLVYIKSSLPCKMLTKFKLPNNIQIIPFELNLRKDKWLFVCIYKPPLLNDQYFVSILSNLLDFYSNEYDNKVVLGDFSLKPSSPSMLSFMDSQNFVSLIKNKTCFKGTGSCIDLILTNRKYSFTNTSSYESGLSDHPHLIYSVMKTTFKCEEPKKLIYRDYSNFFQKDFQNGLLLNTGDRKNNYLGFEKNFVETLNKHAPKKTKIFRGNHQPHINKTLRKAIMKRSQLKNKVNKTKDPKDVLKYKKQRNYVVKLNNQSKQERFDSLNPFLDSKPFWKSCKPYFSNKQSFGGLKIALNESGEILTENMKIAKTFNAYFKSVTDSLELFEWPLQSNASCDKV